jgi:UDP-hydrolysing UDP-N-acetyl-D-glucosamine 2-epimerase
MTKRKVCVVITARPSYSRVKTVLQAIVDHQRLELQLILSGSSLLDRYGSAYKVVEKDGFEVVEKIFNIIEGESRSSMAKTTGLAIMELSTTFHNIKPDVVVTIADRFETIATSIAAAYQNIPLAHIQGGEVSGNIDEKVRHANTKLADIHLVASKDAMQRVIRMGENPDFVINTGCPSIDLAKEILNSSRLNFDPLVKYGGVGAQVSWKDGYIVVMQHPVTTEYKRSKKQIESTLNAVYELNIPTFWFWPNVDAGSDGLSKGIRSFREKYKSLSIHFFKNMEPEDFLKIIKNSMCLIGNSSVGIRESSFLAVPVVNIGSRQNNRQRANNVIDCAYDKDEIKSAINKHLSGNHYKSSYIYGRGDSGKKIANILANIDLTFQKTMTY